MRRVFINENDAVPGQEWFLNRQYPLTAETVEGDMEVMRALIEKTFDRVVYCGDRPARSFLDGYVRKYVQNVASNSFEMC